MGFNISKYIEPFGGGGAVLFDILNHYSLDKIYFSDINSELINVYKVIQSNVNALIIALYELQEYYISLDENNRKKFYYENRNLFNYLKLDSKEPTKIKKASLFIFLNKVCFNGLYRVNKQGCFNVPIGKYKNPKICDAENLKNISKAIQHLNINCIDYQETLNFIDANTFIYIDPPYKTTDSSSFTSYTKTGFNNHEQIRLSKFVHKVNEKGAKIIISNSYTKNSHDNFIEKLYKDYFIYTTEVARKINSNVKSRGKVKELIISNFQEDNMSSYIK